jgi:hypothetical protein
VVAGAYDDGERHGQGQAGLGPPTQQHYLNNQNLAKAAPAT